MRAIPAILLLAFSVAAQPPESELRLAQRAESLAGVHERYRQFIGGLEVIGEDVIVERAHDSGVREIRGRRIRMAPPVQPRIAESAARQRVPVDIVERVDRVLLLADDGSPRQAWRIIGRTHPLEPYAFFIDVGSGEMIKAIPLFANAPALVFAPNPVAFLNDPSLQDNDDSASAVPPAAYVLVELPDLAPSGTLSGPHVRIVDLQPPAKTGADAGGSLLFDRSHGGFEEVMAYYHIDRSQRHLQSLGYIGTKRIINGAIAVDAHAASGADNSYYIAEAAGGGSLYFGDGGVDDAEDADILLHEYGHAIQDSISRGAFFGTAGSQASAMGEGFGDYWAFSSRYATARQSGRDPFCIGDWDARCGNGPSSACGYPAGADCLRRVDSSKTMDNYIFSDQRGTEHRNGEIWSSALRRFFLSMVAEHGVEPGRRIADTVIIESHFGLASTPTFKLLALRMVEADRVLFAGRHQAAICQSMILGKILTEGECSAGRRGDLTLLQAFHRDRAIPDDDPAGITLSHVVTTSRKLDRIYVQVRIRHPYRGDLRLVLIAPDGRSVLLDQPGADSAADIVGIYGLDIEPVESLDIFRGMSAAGEWKLRVVDERPRDSGVVLSWGLIIRYEGEQPFEARPAAEAGAIRIPVVARAAGAEGTNFVSDLRVFNSGAAVARPLAVFTPSGLGGSERFAAMRLELEPGQTVAMDDVVGSLFGTFGSGSLELQGDVSALVATSRTYNRLPDRTFGQFIGPVRQDATTTAGDAPLHIAHLQSTAAFRTNLGVTNLGGGAGTARVEIFDSRGVTIDVRDEPLGPYGHIQFPILTGREEPVARATVSVIAGSAAVTAYGSVVDNASGDSIYVPAERAAGPRALRIPVVVRAKGANDTNWRSDVAFVNTGPESREVALTYHGADGIVRTASVALAGRESRIVSDVVFALFGLSSGRGQVEVGPSDLIVTSRTWTPGATGSYGQFVAARGEHEGLRAGAAHSIQTENSPAYRTNVGLAEVSGTPVTARVRLFDGGGTERFSRILPVPANGQIQFSLAGEGAPDLSNGRVMFEILEGAGSILGYASVIDNRSGDPIFVPAQ